MDFTFYMPVKVISGADAGAKAEQLKRLGERCLIVTGGSSGKTSGALPDMEAALREAGVAYSVFDQIGPNPLVSACFEAGKRARAGNADFIVGIGGGSPLDAAKAAAVYAANPAMQPLDIFGGAARSRALPLCLVGTTAGTGSEVTAVSVLTIDGRNRKKSLKYEDCYAQVVFADAKYTATCPRGVTVSTALDALSHAVEGYYAKAAGDVSREFSLRAVQLIWPELRKLRESPGLPDKAGREALYYGSLWAGLALNEAGTGFPHPAGYALTTGWGVPHGMACAVFLPSFVERNAPAGGPLTGLLFERLGCTVGAFCETVRELSRPGIVKMTREQCRACAGELEGRRNLSNALVSSDVREMLGIYEQLFL